MTAPGRVNSNVLPPWLWLWLVLFFVLMLPYYGAVWVRNLQDLFYTPGAGLDWATNVSQRILGLVGLLELVPSLALLIGILALLWPQQRAKRLEQNYRLKPATPTTPTMTEILEFIEHHAPGMEVRVNRLRSDQTPFVYPLGFRKTAIALFGQLIKLWSADRSAAEAVLLHELAHYRHGDVLIIGAGSPFRAVIEQWGRLYTRLFVIPFILSFILLTLLFFGEIGQLVGLGVGGLGLVVQAIIHKLGQAVFLGFGALVISFGLLLWTASTFVVPMVAIWCSELNADQAPASQSPQTTLNALQRLPEKARGRQWLLFRLAHPPGRLRQWMVTHTTSLFGQVLLLVLFPLSLGLQVWLLRLFAGLGQMLGANIVSINRVTSPQGLSILWLITAGLLAAWPFLAPAWERLFCSNPRTGRLNPLPYWVSAGVLVVIAFWHFP